MHDILTAVTATRPCKTIQINGQDYLRRYYVGTQVAGNDVWLHEFLSSDGERHLHSHPFTARSIILMGGYTEELPGYTEKHKPNPGSLSRQASVPKTLEHASRFQPLHIVISG